MNKITNYNSFHYLNKIIKNDFRPETFLSKGYIQTKYITKDGDFTMMGLDP